MKRYKSFYIDNVIFHNTAEIDSFLKEKAIEAYKAAVEIFCYRRDMASSEYADRKAEYLNEQFGIDWDEIEQIEIETMKAYA